MNINGITGQDDYVEFEHVFWNMSNIDTGAFGINEHCLSYTDNTSRKRIGEKYERVDKYGKLVVASNLHSQSHSTWQPGGALLGISGHWASLIRGKGTDSMGRWAWIAFNAKNNKKIKLISGYRVS